MYHMFSPEHCSCKYTALHPIQEKKLNHDNEKVSSWYNQRHLIENLISDMDISEKIDSRPQYSDILN